MYHTIKMKLFAVTILIASSPIYSLQIPNDECIGATIIPPDIALPYTDIIPNFGNATKDLIDSIPSCAASSDAVSVWYYWEPSSTVFVDISSIGESQTGNNFICFYPTIAIFEGNDCRNLKELACAPFLYIPAFEATAGKEYFIVISDLLYGQSSTLTFAITITPPQPPSDECVDALVIPSTISFPFSTPPVLVSLATENPNDPVSTCTLSTESPTSAPNASPTTAPTNFPTSAPFDFPTMAPVKTLKTVWYTWIPFESGMYDFRTEKSAAVFGLLPSDYTSIEIYKGNSCDSLTEIACSRAGQGGIRGAILNTGVEYFIKVVNEFQDFGTSIILTVNPTPSYPPKNDDCINAIVINPVKGDIIRGDTFSATSDDIEFDDTSSCFAFDSPGVWYKFTVPKPMLINVSTLNEGTSYDSTLAILSGDQCGELQCVVFNDDAAAQGCGVSSKVSFVATESTTYYIFVQGWDKHRGSFEMTVDARMNFFALIDSKTNQYIQPIENNDYFDYDTLPSSMLNIQTNFENKVKSVMVTFDNPPRSVCERKAPFVVFGNHKNDYFGVTIPVGQHTVTATPYHKANCKGRAGTKISKSFNMEECTHDYQYYDFTSTGNSTKPSKFYSDEVIPACNINIEVLPKCGFEIGFVEFKIRSTTTSKIVQTKREREAPYLVFGNRGDVIHQGSLKPNNYTIELNIDGIQHSSISFAAVDNGSCK